MDIQPRREAKGDRPTIGIRSSHGLEIGDFRPLAGMANPPVYHGVDPKDRSRIDVLAAAGPVGDEPMPLADVNQYDRLLARHVRDDPIKHVIERRSMTESGAHGPVLEWFELTLPANHFVDFGLRLAIEPISGIRKDSPADKAGFRKGDRSSIQRSGRLRPHAVAQPVS